MRIPLAVQAGTLALWVFNQAAPLPPPQEVAAALQKKYDAVRDFTASYTEGGGPDTYALRLQPKLPERDYDWLQLIVDRKTLQIRTLSAADSQGGRSTFHFSNFKENTGLSDKTFIFKIPRGADVTTTGASSR